MATHALQYPSKHPAQDESFIKFPRKLLAAAHWVSLVTGETISFTSSDKLLWLWMKDRHDFFTGSGGEWYDNQDAMAAAAGVSVATVKRLLKALEKHGYLVRRKRGLSNSYTIKSDLQTMVAQSAQNEATYTASTPAPAPAPARPAIPDARSDCDTYQEYCDSNWPGDMPDFAR